MANIKLWMALPNGENKQVEVPDDVPVKELLPEMVTALKLPVTATDGRPMNYELSSKALGRKIREDETLALAKIPSDDRMTFSPKVTAG
jgi:hypothetical protein